MTWSVLLIFTENKTFFTLLSILFLGNTISVGEQQTNWEKKCDRGFIKADNLERSLSFVRYNCKVLPSLNECITLLIALLLEEVGAFCRILKAFSSDTRHSIKHQTTTEYWTEIYSGMLIDAGKKISIASN